MTKKAVKLSIEENLLDEGKKHIPNLSSFFEEVLIHYLGYGEEVQFKVLRIHEYGSDKREPDGDHLRAS